MAISKKVNRIVVKDKDGKIIADIKPGMYSEETFSDKSKTLTIIESK